MRSASVVMDSPLFDGHFQVALGERNEEVQALSAQASTQTLAYGVGFGRPYQCSQYSHTRYGTLPEHDFGRDEFLRRTGAPLGTGET